MGSDFFKPLPTPPVSVALPNTLAGHKMHRVIHNLLAVSESVDIFNQGQFERARAIYEQGSLKYRGEYKRWVPLTRS